jgi:hypothetical protein
MLPWHVVQALSWAIGLPPCGSWHVTQAALLPCETLMFEWHPTHDSLAVVGSCGVWQLVHTA